MDAELISLAVGIAAALAAVPLNRLAVSRLTDAMVWLVPVMEEALKTGAALTLASQIPLVHTGFGLAEMVYDVFWMKSTSALAAGIDVIGHSLFGVITWSVWRVTGSWLAGVGVAIVVHSTWNRLVGRLTAK